MKVLYLYCHPLDDSFHAAIRAEAVKGLNEAGHVVDMLDLYADGFDPVVTAERRRRYHETTENKAELADYIARLHGADALVVQFPTWSFGPPAMLKGYFDRMFMPSVAFDLSNPGKAQPMLTNLKSITGIVTYGRPWRQALFIGDPPKKIVMRYLWWFTGLKAKRRYLALYHMNVATLAQREGFIAKVGAAMRAL
ncbi:MAG: NAD(P)H-dependent oxidoreductase [Alphaproteobacteria bacterium]|jgi:putative NADPH-quinone reductase